MPRRLGIGVAKNRPNLAKNQSNTHSNLDGTHFIYFYLRTGENSVPSNLQI